MRRSDMHCRFAGISCLLVAVFLRASAANAEDSIGYRFTSQLLEALIHCDAAHYYLQEASKQPDNVTKFLMNQHLADDEFNRCQIGIREFSQSQVFGVRNTATLVDASVTSLREHNKDFMGIMSGEKFFNSNEEFNAAGAKALADMHSDWKLLMEAITFTTYVLVEPASSHEPTGPVPFRVSPDERKWLRAQIARSFGEKIEAFKQAKNRGEPADVSALIFGVMELDDLLASDVY